jgi:hypothetical protein
MVVSVWFDVDGFWADDEAEGLEIASALFDEFGAICDDDGGF